MVFRRLDFDEEQCIRELYEHGKGGAITRFLKKLQMDKELARRN